MMKIRVLVAIGIICMWTGEIHMSPPTSSAPAFLPAPAISPAPAFSPAEHPPQSYSQASTLPSNPRLPSNPKVPPTPQFSSTPTRPPTSTSQNELPVAVRVIWRYGDRSVFHPTYRRDPFGSRKFWPQGYGRLTSEGRQQHVERGQLIRQMYPHLVHEADKIYVESTNLSRTILSAKANIQGLYPSNPAAISINAIPIDTDHFLLMSEKCPRFDFLMHTYMMENNTRYTNAMEESVSMMQRVSYYSGTRQKTITDNWRLFDALNVEQTKGYNIPKWAKAEMEHDGLLRRNAYFYYDFFTRKNEMKLLRSGYLLQSIVETADAIVNGTEPNAYKLWMSFAHDTTIASLLDSLVMFYPPHVPPFASGLIFEIFKGVNGNKPYMKLRYLKSPTDIQTLYVTGCGEKCSLSGWRRLYGHIFPGEKSYTEACQLRPGDSLPEGKIVP